MIKENPIYNLHTKNKHIRKREYYINKEIKSSYHEIHIKYTIK